MSLHCLSGAAILGTTGWLSGHTLVIERSLIAAIVPDDMAPAGERTVLNGGSLVPGFIDVQVNGGGGMLFNDAPTLDTIAAIGRAHRRFGTTGFLPTLISDTRDKVAQAIAAVEQAIAAGVPGVLGIHLEGPFLNADKRGIHDARQFQTIDGEAIDLLSSLPNGVTIVTLAPELAPPGAIAELTRRGLVVMAGHSMASYEVTAGAQREGLAGVTHLFNAMTQLESRTPGLVGAALDLRLYAGIIVDGHHVHPASLRIAYQILGTERLVLVTDAMPTVGGTTDRFVLGGTPIVNQDGALRAADGTLAGSNLDMASAVRNSLALLEVGLEDACRMAALTPATLLGLKQSRGTLAPGMAADLVHLDDRLEVAGTWIAGSSE